MKVLVVGGGGREHALAWKLAQSSSKPEILCAPGNAGTAEIARNVAVAATDKDGLLKLAKDEKPALTVVGPEQPLCDGIGDMFRAEGLRVFGPTKSAARLEGSKAFAKQIMASAKIPTAAHRTFTNFAEAERHLTEDVAFRSSSKRRGSRRGKASSSRRRARRRSRRRGAISSNASSATRPRRS
jgi:phosphoribosylamine---glycine ligase